MWTGRDIENLCVVSYSREKCKACYEGKIYWLCNLVDMDTHNTQRIENSRMKMRPQIVVQMDSFPAKHWKGASVYNSINGIHPKNVNELRS